MLKDTSWYSVKNARYAPDSVISSVDTAWLTEFVSSWINRITNNPYLLSTKKNKSGRYTRIALACRGGSDRKDKIITLQFVKFE